MWHWNMRHNNESLEEKEKKKEIFIDPTVGKFVAKRSQSTLIALISVQ